MYNPVRQPGEVPRYLKVWTSKTHFDRFECGKLIEARCNSPHTLTVTDVANGIVVELPRDGKVVYHEDENGTTIDTFRPLTPIEGEKEGRLKAYIPGKGLQNVRGGS